MKQLFTGVALLLSVSLFAEEKTCAALRGNGQLMLSHFGALARITETYGVMDGMAGGSSGSISTFLYESILLNPAVSKCGNRDCTPKEKARRAALLLKAAPEIVEVMKKSPEALAVQELMKLQAEIRAGGVNVLLNQQKVQQATKALQTIFKSKEFSAVINPDLNPLLANGRTQEIVDQITNFGKFEATDPAIFFRPGFINFKAAPYVFGKVADFYSGRGPVEQAKLSNFLDRCARAEDLGKDWYTLDEVCRTDFHKQYTNYRKKYDKAPEFNHRKDDKIGATLPALISTSVLEGQTASNKFRETRDAYLAKPTLNPTVDFKPGFENVKFGYWGRSADLARVEEKVKPSGDLKGSKFTSLGEAPWSAALTTSPAEPGIANGQEIDSTHISLGGWSDLHPVQSLKAMGCTRVIYVTRRGPESTFAVGVAKLLGMTQAQEDKLYTLTNGGSSSYQEALKMADAIWCTNWNIADAQDVKGTFQEAFKSTLVTQNEFFKTPLQGSAEELVAELKIEGCDGATGSPVGEAQRNRPPLEYINH